MSGFDELADEISDEDWDAAWEAYTSGADPLVDATALRGFVDLPIGIVEVRGDDIGLTNIFPRARLGVGDADLTDPEAVLDVSGTGPVNWSLTNRRSGITESGSCDGPASATRAVMDALIRLDDDNIYLDIQMVDNGRMGVGLVDVTGDSDHYDSGRWLGSEWVVLSHDLVVLRPGSRTVTALRLVGTTSGLQQLRVERSTIDVLVFILPTGREAYAGTGDDADELDTVRALFERVRLSRRSMSFEHIGLVTAVIREVVAGALSLPVSKADLDEVPFGLTQLARDGQLLRRDPTESAGPVWRSRVAELLGPIAHVPSNSAALPEARGRAVLIGSALDALDRGVAGSSVRPLHSSAESALGSDRRSAEVSGMFGAEDDAIVPGDPVDHNGGWMDPEAIGVEPFGGPAHEPADGSHEPPISMFGAEPWSGLSRILEFLVDADDRDHFEAALIDSGLQRVSASVTNRDLYSTSLRSFRADPGSSTPDLTIVTTTTVGTGLFASLLDLEDFFRMAVPVRLGSTWIRGLDPVHRFILACIRFSAGEDERSSEEMVVNNMPWSRTTADRVLRLADRCGALTPVRNTVKELWDTVPPLLHPVLEELVD